MNTPADENLLRLLRLTREMLALANQGDGQRQDPSCGVIYGLLRDSAYKLGSLARQESERHAQVDLDANSVAVDWSS